MEIIKKTILQSLIIETTVTGGTIIMPDLNAVYHMKIGIIGVMKDVGFLDAYVAPPPPPPPPVPPVPVETYYWIDTDDDVFIDSDGSFFIQ